MAKKLPKIINREEYEKLIKATQNKISNAGKKRKVIIKQFMLAMILGFEAGMRISEIVGLKDKIQKLQKKQIENNCIRIIGGKGNKDRVVPKPKRINQNAIAMLPLTINRRPLQKYITQLGRDVLNKEITFHTLRHGFVTECINRGMPLHEVQMFAGHSRLDTTGIYLHANPVSALKRYDEVF